MEIISKIKDEFMKSPIFNTLLILVIIYLISKKTIENFTATSAPSTTTQSGISQENLQAIDNLAEIAKILNSNGTVTIPGNLVVSGTTQFNNDVTIGTENTGKKLTVFAKNNVIDKNHKITLGNHGNDDNTLFETWGGDGQLKIKNKNNYHTHFNYIDSSGIGINYIRGKEIIFNSVMDDRKKIVINTTNHRDMIKLYHTSNNNNTKKGGKIGASDAGLLLINGFTDDSNPNNILGSVIFQGRKVARQGDQISLTNWPGGCGVVRHGYGCDGRNFDRQVIL